MNTDAILDNVKQVRGVVRGSQDGEAFASSGDIDADTVCAVAAVSSEALLRVGELLCAGPLERWHFATREATYYVSERAHERLIAVGEPVRNAETTSKSLHSAR